MPDLHPARGTRGNYHWFMIDDFVKSIFFFQLPKEWK